MSARNGNAARLPLLAVACGVAAVVVLLLLSYWRAGRAAPTEPVDRVANGARGTGARGGTEGAPLRGRTPAERLEMAKERIRQGLKRPENPLLDPQGRVSVEALERMGEQNHLEEITAAVQGAREEMEGVLAGAMRRKTRLEKADHRVYWIPAQPEAGAEILRRLKGEFNRISGPEAAEKLMESFAPRWQFGDFGQMNIRVDFNENKKGEERDLYTCYDVESGIAVEAGLMGLPSDGYLRKVEFGGLFGDDGKLRR